MLSRFAIFTASLLGWTMTVSSGLGASFLLTNDTTIAKGDAAYDGGDLMVQGCILTIAGDHGFSGVELRTAGTVIFTGTNLAAKAVSLREASTMRLAGGSTLAVNGTLAVLDHSTVVCLGKNTTNRLAETWAGVGVLLNADRVTIDATSSVQANGQGYNCPGAGQSGNGPGGGRRGWWGGPNACGGGHGGVGGSGNRGGFVNAPGSSYGSAATPSNLGSAGGGVDGVGGAGGGAIRLVASDTLALEGVISANGNPSSGWAAGGAGGSIWISAGRLTGAGSVQAHGGTADGSGGGGGGRVAIYSATNQFTGVTNCEVRGGVGPDPGQSGTLAFFDTSTPQTHLWVYQRFALEPNGTYSFGAITVTERGQLLLGDGAYLEVNGMLRVTNGSTLTIGGDSRLKVSGAFEIVSNSVVLCQGLNTTGQVSHAWAGVGATVEAGAVTVDATSRIAADGLGYTGRGVNRDGNGPGGGRAGWWGGPYASGAGHGGVGGTGDKHIYKNPGGLSYGSTAYPLDLGSAGGGSDNPGAPGGGAIHLTVRGALNLDGSIRANGDACTGDGAGGAGGSVLINARSLAGSGFLSADGGVGSASGGGGRIAVYYWDSFGLVVSNVTAQGGLGSRPGQNGTVHLSNAPKFVWLRPAGLCHDLEPLAWTVLAVNPFELTTELRAAHAGRERVIGSGLQAMGHTNWDTTLVPDGVYELRASFRDPQLQLVGEAIQPVLVNNSVRWHSGYLESNEVWTAGTVHVVESTLTVGAGVTLTLEPGAVVKNAAGARWIIESGASVDALGTNGANIVLTSLADDTAAGDSNLDGNLSGPRPGDWAVTGPGAAALHVNAFADLRYGTMLHSGAVSQNEVWPGTMLHRITENLTVTSGAAVTIQPGAIIKFDAMRMLTVGTGARLSAIGTQGQPITFTSIKDDAVGGDTNQDGDQTRPEPGDWQMIVIDGAQAAFEHALVTFGAGTPDGQYAGTGAIRGSGVASVTVSNSVIRSVFFEGICWSGAELTIVNTLIAQTDRAVNADAGIMRLIHCTLDDNRIGLWGHGGRIEAVNTIISHSLEAGVTGPIVNASLRYCNVWSPSGVNYAGTDLTGQSGNISADPKFTDRDSGNYRLNFRSPCIDAADGAAASPTDQMGAPRYDDPRTANTGIAATNGAFVDMGAFEFVETAISDVDLIVTLVSGPNEATAGGTATVRWTVANRGTGRAIGPWHDAIAFVPRYVSAVRVIPVVEVLSGQGFTLGPDATASFSAQVRVPGGTEGPWSWQVRANCRAEVFEGALLDNNTTLAVADTELRNPSLTVGALVSGAFAAVAVPSWFKLEQPAGQELLVTLDASTQNGRCRVYAGMDRMPTVSTFDLRSAVWDSPDARLALPAPGVDRTVYLLVMPETINDGKFGFSLSAQPVQFMLDRIGLASAGNAGPVTIPLFGSGFAPGLRVFLRPAGGSNLLAQSISLADSTRADATFDLTGIATGSYTVVATQEGREISLANTFTVQPGAGGQLWTRYVLPSAVRVERDFVAYLEYGNSGDANLAAPLLHLGYDGDPSMAMWAPGESQEGAGTLQQNTGRGMAVLGVALDGTQPGVLRPGSSYSIPLGMRALEARVFAFGIHPLKEDTQTPNYSDVARMVAPPQTDATWQRAWQKVMQEAGPTRAGYVAALRGAATRARQYGLDLTEETDLLRFLIEEAVPQVQTAPVAGHLFLAGANHPLGKKTIRLVRKDYALGETNSVFTGTSWYDGSFSVAGVTAGSYLVSVDTYLPETVMEIQLTDPVGSPITNLTVIVTSPGGQISGLVTAGVSASPVAGATVTARKVGTGVQYVGLAETNGTYVVKGLPPGDYELELWASGYLPQPWRYFPIEAGEQIDQSFNLSLGGGRVTGRVLNSQGQAVAGAKVAVHWEGGGNPFGLAYGYDDVSTGAGAYRITGLPPGTYGIAASTDGIGISTVTNVVITDLHANVMLDLILRLGAPLQGVVVDAVTRQPVAGAKLTVGVISGGRIEASADNLGRFTLTGLGVDQYSITVTANNYLPVRVQTQAAATTTPPLTIELGQLGTVNGHVLSRGSPVAGISIIVQWTNGLGDQTQTDAQGHFGFRSLPPGTYRIAVGPEAGPHLWGQDFTISATNASNITRDFNFDALSSVSGRTYDASGAAALTNATVFLVKNNEVIVQASTDASGAYGFYVLEPGVFDLYAMAMDKWLTPLPGMVVGTNQQLTGVNLLLPTNGLSITVTSQTNGQPLSQALVRVESVTNGAGLLTCGGWTTNDGTCSIASVPRTQYRIGASADGFAYSEQTITVYGTVTTVALALPPGKRLHGAVTTNGNPKAGVLVQVAQTNRGVLFVTQTDDQGRYQFTSLPAGTFTLAVLPRADYVAERREGIRTDLVEDSQVDVALSPIGGATVTGKAEDVTGHPAAGTVLILEDAHKVTCRAAVADGSIGGYVLESCPAGAFTVVAQRQGYLPLRQEVVTANATVLSNVSFVFAAPVAWPATQPLKAPGAVIASWNGRGPNETTADWLSGWLAGLEDPNDLYGATAADIRGWLNSCASIHDTPCVPEYLCDPDGIKYGNLALRDLNDWGLIYTSDVRSLDEYRKQMGVAAAKSAAVLALFTAACAVFLGFLGGPTGGIAAGMAFLTVLSAVYAVARDLQSGTLKLMDLFNTERGLWTAFREELKTLLGFGAKLGGLLFSAAGLYFALNSASDAWSQLNQADQEAVRRYTECQASFNANLKAFGAHQRLVWVPDDCWTNAPGGSNTLVGVKAMDPNAKLTVGIGPGGWVPAESPITYTIQFENKADASAPAQQVVVTDQLAPELDWSTLEFQQIAFNDAVVNLPPGLQSYRTLARVGSDPNPVRVEATLDPDTGTAVWTLTSIDAGTGELTADPLAGFLPPNDATHRGEGYLTYAVRAKTGWPSGTQITNQAAIFFDVNPSIATQVVTNTLDAGPPTSRVLALPALNNSVFVVRWSGEDDPRGSGVNSFDILYSTNGTHYELWLETAAETSAPFTGMPGATYFFYSVAVDKVGHREPAPSTPDATTTIATNSPPMIPPLGTFLAHVGRLFHVQPGVVASPGQRPVFSLAPGAPAGSQINPNDGMFTWTPSPGQASTTNLVTLRVADSASPTLTSEQSFTVIVADYVQIDCATTLAIAGTSNRVSLMAFSSVALTNLSFNLSMPTDRMTNQYVEPLAGLVCAANADPGNATNARISLVLCAGQVLHETEEVGGLRFSVFPNAHSGLVPLLFTDLRGQRTDGTWVTNLDGSIGRVTIVGEEPLLEASPGTNQTIMLTIYGLPGSTCSLESCASIEGGAWQTERTGVLTNHVWRIEGVTNQAPHLFFRGRKW